MPIPGYDVTLVDAPVPAGAPTATDTLFLVDFAGAGPYNAPQLVLSPDKADSVFGLVSTPVGHSQMQACLDAFFANGGARAYVVRAGGPSATSGDDKHANITNTEWAAAIDSFPASLGPGQLLVPSLTTAGGHGLQSTHVFARNRFALLVPPSGATDGDLEGLADATIATQGGRFCALWRDYVTAPGRVYGTTRTVPWAAVQAGLIAASDRLTGNPNLEAAGENGIAPYVTAILSEVDESRRSALRDVQVNTARTVYGQARAYGARTLADLTAIPHWWNVGGARTVMYAKALIAEVDEGEVFGQIDGQGIALNLYNGRLRGKLLPLWENGALYGDTASQSFSVDTGPGVNTEATIKAGEKRARVALKTSPNAEHVVTFLSRVAIDQTV